MDHGVRHIDVPLRLALLPSAADRPAQRLTPNRRPLWLLLLAVAALGVALSPLVASVTVKIAIVASAAGLAAAALALARPRKRAPVSPPAPRKDCLLVDDTSIRIVRDDRTAERLVDLDQTFGFALLTNAERSHLVLALTTGDGSLCVGSDIGSLELRRFDLLMPHAVTMCREDLARAAMSADGEPLRVGSTALLQLIDTLTQRDASSLGRFVLTDVQGREVTMDRERLSTARGTIRLDQPFEWRAIRFREGSGAAGTEFQGTWVRQGMQEIVLVSLQAGDVRESIHDIKRSTPGLDPMLRLDARLAHGARSAPPPFDQRIAVDRLYMLPLRRVLDGAHVESRSSIPGDASLGR